MLIGFGDADVKGRRSSARANLWRTCVRSLIHDIPETSSTAGQQSCPQGCGSAGRDRWTSLIFIVTPAAPRVPADRAAASADVFPARRELWPRPTGASLSRPGPARPAGGQWRHGVSRAADRED